MAQPELLVRSLLFGLKDVLLPTHICRRAEHICDLSIYTLHCTFAMHEYYIPFNSKFSFTPCRLHPASNGNSISESHPEYEGHAHHYVITITSSRGLNGGSSALLRPSSYTAAPRRTAPGPSNLCPSYLITLITIHSSYGCLVKKRKKKKNM